ncbi:MAG TPA: alpha/beta hydrolase [Anaerolineae bacterium]
MAQRKIDSGKVLVGLAAVGLAALWYGNARIDKWETLTSEDAPDGEFVTLEDGSRVHYIVAGQGHPVILVHGWRDSGYTWRKNIPDLAKYFRVYALDLPGFGFSTRYAEAIYTVPQFARWVAQFMKALKIPSAHIVGNSLGGATALELSYERPELVDKLVLEDAWAYPFLEQSAWLVRMLPRFVPRGLLGALATNRWAHKVFAHSSLGDPARFDPESIEIAIRSSRVRGSIEAIVAMVELPMGHNVWRRFDRCQSETLVIWGERDITFPVSHGYRLARELPNARLMVLPKAGHLPHSECPELVNEMLVNFLTQTDGRIIEQTKVLEMIG